MRGEVCVGWGGLRGEVSGREWKVKGEGRGTYTLISALPLDDVEVNPKQFWPKRIFGLPEVGVD